jgi:hypothetical protein
MAAAAAGAAFVRHCGADMREPRSRLLVLASLLLSFTCAHPAPPAPAAVAAPAATADDVPTSPLPKRPAPPPVQDHPELRPLTVVMRDASGGFETLVVTMDGVGCAGQATGAAEVRIEGASDARRPWSFVMDSLNRGRFRDVLPSGPSGTLVVRRPLPPPGERT